MITIAFILGIIVIAIGIASWVHPVWSKKYAWIGFISFIIGPVLIIFSLIYASVYITLG